MGVMPARKFLAVPVASSHCAEDNSAQARLGGMLLVVGEGPNYALFFENQSAAGGWFEQQPLDGVDPQTTVASARACNASTAIGFGSLRWRAQTVLSAIGVTVALGALLSLIFSAVLADRAAAERQR
jgi:predicted exporter